MKFTLVFVGLVAAAANLSSAVQLTASGASDSAYHKLPDYIQDKIGKYIKAEVTSQTNSIIQSLLQKKHKSSELVNTLDDDLHSAV